MICLLAGHAGSIGEVCIVLENAYYQHENSIAQTFCDVSSVCCVCSRPRITDHAVMLKVMFHAFSIKCPSN
jgi:hypothetical protein